MSFWKFWEPEETVGQAWHDAVRDWDAEPAFPDASVAYDSVKTSIGILFRSLGGPVGAEIMPYAASVSKHRLSLKRLAAHDVDHVTQASYDGMRLAMPASVALFADPGLARGLYLWLGALAAQVETPFVAPDDPLQCDIAMLRAAHRAENVLLERLPGYRAVRARLAEAVLATRKVAQLPKQEAELEEAIRALLAQAPESADDNATLRAIRDGEADLSGFVAEREYKPFRPVALWPMLAAPRAAQGGGYGDDNSEPSSNSAEGSEKTLKGKRRQADQADRRDSLILYRFESILSWVEFLNINRKVEDDEEDNARKAADDLDEISLAKNSKSAKTKLKFHLDLAPRDVDMSRLIGEHVYPEWDWKSGSYLADHVSVQEKLAEEADDSALDKPRARRRIAAVRRQFEALRPRRRIVRRQTDGFDLDIDEVIRARCDFLASGEASDRLYSAIRDDERDLAVSVLIDTSRSTESAVSGRPVIEIAREALAALVGGIDACGDAVSVHAFSSLRRDRVMVELVKDFDEENSAVIRRRIMSLTPKFYTRLGAALRHVSRHLEKRSAQRRLLLVITDGKPNDLDHYEGRHGIEDTRRAVIEARRLGQAVFAVTVDARAQDYIPHLFGQNGFAIVPDAEKLVEALPEMYRHVVA
jgi:nitric oxide reductase NorD protein